jgi:hypothetical protein
MTATIGRIVHYRLSADDVTNIKAQRLDNDLIRGNQPCEGQVLPLIVTIVWPNEYGDHEGINGQVLLDGNDSLWVTSRKDGAEPGCWSWPPRT